MRLSLLLCIVSFFFFNDTATTEIYTLSLHDALPISGRLRPGVAAAGHGEGDAHHHHHSEQQSHRSERFLQDHAGEDGNDHRRREQQGDRKSTRLNSSHGYISYAVFCLKKKKKKIT